MNSREAFDEWWVNFKITYEEWRFADSETLRKATWEAACKWQKRQDADICNSVQNGLLNVDCQTGAAQCELAILNQGKATP